MRNDTEVQNVVRNLFIGVAPERQPELSDLWKKYTPRFNILADTGPDGNFVFDAGAYRDVRINNRAMRTFWLASFIAWEGYRVIAESSDVDNVDLTRFQQMIDCFFRILNEDNPDTVPLPDGIPDPGIFPDKQKDTQMRAAAELAIFAGGWALLHEVRHIQHQQDGTGAVQTDPPEKWRDEELSCDHYATHFLLDKVDEYVAAPEERDDLELVRQKREIGIYFALFAMVLINTDHWHETDTHPAMERRISEVMREMKADGSRRADDIAHKAFEALWKIFPDAPGPFKSSNN